MARKSSKQEAPSDSALNENEERFVQEFMVDRDWGAAALRTGVARINLKRTLQKWRDDPRILRAIQARTDSMEIGDMISPQRIVAGFMDVAFDRLAPPAARNSALKELASIKQMYASPDDDKPSAGVIFVPATPDNLKEWAEAAATSQAKLKDEVRH